MRPRQSAGRSATFYDHLKLALELIGDPAQLGGRSPLATPYVLGDELRGAPATREARGEVLAALIAQAAESLWGGPLPEDGQELFTAAVREAPPAGRYDCLILELNYFKRRYRPAPRNQAEIYGDILHISRPTHDRHLRAAIDRLGVALLQRLRPALHLERPAPPAMLVGRELVLDSALAGLRAGKAISIVGPGGVGKTALGAAIAERWGGQACLWYTFRPGLNDRLESLLFALGYFLHRQGASTLWQQLVADHGRVTDTGLAIGLALTDLAALPDVPLLCFDELDVLRPDRDEQAGLIHTAVLELLDGLRGHAPLLLMGQRAFWPGDALFEVETLGREQLAGWLEALAVPHSAADVASLHAYTGGNPRLAELCVALYQAGAGADFAEVIEQLPRSPALVPLWRRLERYLSAEELHVVRALAVFRSPAPADVWQAGPSGNAEALARLVRRRLAQEDGRGGVALLPALREVVYGELPVEQREELHAQAALIRAERAAYTAAAYHLERAGQPEAAIELWYTQRAQEIEQGQAASAMAILSQISQRRLSPRHRKLLLLMRAELHELAGAPAHVVAELGQAPWMEGEVETPEAMLRLGRAIEAQGQPERALQVYERGLDAVVALLRHGTQLHVQRSLTAVRRREVRHAWREARLAHFNAETMLGIVRDQSGDYDAARGHYLTALAIAEEFGHQTGIAQTHHYLAMLAGRRQALHEALPNFAQAMAFYERVGDRLNREYVRSNLASAYIQASQFADAIEPAEQALRFFEAMGNSFRVAQNASNLAEAHAELGNLDPAEQYARVVLGQDEPHSHPYALYTLGTVYLKRGNLAESERFYEQSRRLAEANDDSYLLAFALRALGEVVRAQGATTRADEAFARSVELFRQLNIEAEARRTEQLAAQGDAKTLTDDA